MTPLTVARNRAARLTAETKAPVYTSQTGKVSAPYHLPTDPTRAQAQRALEWIRSLPDLTPGECCHTCKYGDTYSRAWLTVERYEQGGERLP